MVMATSKKTISFHQKLDIIASIEKGEKQISVCQWLSLAKTTVNTIWKHGESQAQLGILQFQHRLQALSFSPASDVAEEEPSAKDHDEPVACPTFSEYHSVLNIVRHFVTCRSTDNQYLNVVNSLDELLYSVSFNRQTTVTEFFHS